MHAERRDLPGATRQGGDTIATAAHALRRGDTTSAALTDACLRAIETRDSSINAFITVLADEARAQAAQADRELKGGPDRGPLHGIPISIKDLFDIAGHPTTAASRVRAAHIAARDAAVITRLRAAGAVIIGKTNLHEFAFGTTNEESAFGPVRHPLDPGRSPGGSSGGSAASILAGMAFASVGTDTGGSVRIPAAACGLVGLKPSPADVPLDGVVPLSTTLDYAGPLCRSVEDAETLFRVLSGIAAPSPTGHAAAGPSVRGLRLGVPGGYFTAVLDAQVAATFALACDRLRDAGAVLDEVSLPHAADIPSIYLHIVLAEAAAYHASALENRADAYTAPVRLRLEMGRYILAEDYMRALRGRDVLRGEVDAVLAARDGLVLPALAIPAPRLGAVHVRIGGSDEPIRSVMLRLTQLFNITGHPAITLPCGATTEGMPVGLQIAGRAGETLRLLRLARTVEPYVGPGRSG
jgi:aspartyl-tRNA(Asn)/glutamyl-tRNA(Gln) amidotransferase subunit A